MSMSSDARRPYSRARGGSIRAIDRTYTGVGHRRSVRSTRVRRPPCPAHPFLPTGRAPQQRVLKRVLAVVAAVCVGGLAAGAGPALAAFPGANGKIAFTSDRAGTADIWTMSPNGRDLVNLTPTSPADDAFPNWRADGRKIVFESDRETPGTIPHRRGSKAPTSRSSR